MRSHRGGLQCSVLANCKVKANKTNDASAQSDSQSLTASKKTPSIFISSFISSGLDRPFMSSMHARVVGPS